MVTISGLYAVTADCRDTDELLRKVDQALAGGARIVQYRNKTADPTARLVQARALAVLCQRHHVPLIVNDSVEIALLAGADGVHLGRDDGEVGAARALLGERLIGVSCYDRIDHALAAQRAGADYVAFGAAFPSPTKPSAAHASLALFRAARQQITLPIVAIGGITADNARQLIEAGVDSVAVITALFGAADIAAQARQFNRLFVDGAA